VFYTSPSAIAGTASSIDDINTEIIVLRYSTPVIITNNSVVSGYYLDGEGYKDVAVLNLLAFESESYIEF
jgi:hypothetical protein